MLEELSQHLPKLPFPKKRPDLVDDGGGGGLYSSDLSVSKLRQQEVSRWQMPADPYLELRGRRRAGLAHGICSMHFGGVAER